MQPGVRSIVEDVHEIWEPQTNDSAVLAQHNIPGTACAIQQ